MASDTQLQSILEWHKLVGVDETIASKPVNRVSELESQPLLDTPINQKSWGSFESSFTKSKPTSPDLTASVGLISQSSHGSVKAAAEIAASANSIEDLRIALENFDGCTLKKTATNLVFVDGNDSAEILFIGEGPGAEEDRQGRPFVGPSGILLEKMLASIGLSRHKVLISNTVFWRPPGNRTPTPQEIITCLPFVERLIEIVKPKILVPLGGAAAKSLLGESQGIGRLRGHWFEFKAPNLSCPVISTPMFHPAYLLRTSIQKRAAWNDLRRVRRKLDELHLATPNS